MAMINMVAVVSMHVQGEVVRKLKSDKAEKSLIDGEVKKLLALKQKLATASGQSPTKPDSSKGKKKGGKK